MKPSFARNRLNALLRTQAFGAVGSRVPRITDMFVSGSVVGVDALAGAVCAAVLIAFVPQVVTALGIPKGEIFVPAVSALRICAFELPFSVMMAFLISHLLAVNRVSLSFAGTLLEQFVLTTGCTVALCGLWGVDMPVLKRQTSPEEIRELKLKTEAKGLTLVPLKIFLKHGKVKVDLGVCRGKQAHDKRDALKEKAIRRDLERA